MNASTVAPKYKKGGYLLAFFLFPAILCFIYYYFVVRKPLVSGDDSVFVKLAYFGPKQLAANGKDTIYHSIPDFTFVNQEGKIITQKLEENNNNNETMYSLFHNFYISIRDNKPTSKEFMYFLKLFKMIKQN